MTRRNRLALGEYEHRQQRTSTRRGDDDGGVTADAHRAEAEKARAGATLRMYGAPAAADAFARALRARTRAKSGLLFEGSSIQA